MMIRELRLVPVFVCLFSAVAWCDQNPIVAQKRQVMLSDANTPRCVQCLAGSGGMGCPKVKDTCSLEVYSASDSAALIKESHDDALLKLETTKQDILKTLGEMPPTVERTMRDNVKDQLKAEILTELSASNAVGNGGGQSVFPPRMFTLLLAAGILVTGSTGLAAGFFWGRRTR